MAGSAACPWATENISYEPQNWNVIHYRVHPSLGKLQKAGGENNCSQWNKVLLEAELREVEWPAQGRRH